MLTREDENNELVRPPEQQQPFTCFHGVTLSWGSCCVLVGVTFWPILCYL